MLGIAQGAQLVYAPKFSTPATTPKREQTAPLRQRRGECYNPAAIALVRRTLSARGGLPGGPGPGTAFSTSGLASSFLL